MVNRLAINGAFIWLINISTSNQRESKIRRTVDTIFVKSPELKVIIFTISKLSNNKIIIPTVIMTDKGIGISPNMIKKNKIFIINKRRFFISYSIKIVLFQAFY